MKFFLDTADLGEIREAVSWGVIDGVTTNPSLFAKTGGKLADFERHIGAICELCPGLPVSAESCAETAEGMVEDGRRLAAIADNVVVKLPISTEALAATHTLAQEGIAVNMTLIFTVPQALLAARAGARYVSPFVGRFDDIAEDGVEQLVQVCEAIHGFDFGHEVEIIGASIRTPHHVTEAALAGCDIATVPFKALKKAVRHPLTDRGLALFMEDWKKVEQA
ncbi:MULTISPECIES: transaldolase family protein [Enorma]|uniref:Transaldolase n=1 Tax=[Collinsella] massiliensis TaxID=1232426 RepID=A0A1Y3XL35_9ACTN|nr:MULTISPECIES: transaldolase family protein [Enorma]OUN86236.1 transaldolase [[Collinsella] massiliensis]